MLLVVEADTRDFSLQIHSWDSKRMRVIQTNQAAQSKTLPHLASAARRRDLGWRTTALSFPVSRSTCLRWLVPLYRRRES